MGKPNNEHRLLMSLLEVIKSGVCDLTGDPPATKEAVCRVIGEEVAEWQKKNKVTWDKINAIIEMVRNYET